MKNKFRLTADRGATSNLSVMLTVPTVTKGSRVMTYVAPVWLGKICFALSFVLFFTLSPTPQQGFCFSGRGEVYSDTEIVNAIKLAENSARYPYGIKSIDTGGNEEYARKICFNSVRNGRERWKKAGKPDDLIVFIGKRYCPPTEHSLNKNWVKNVKYFLERRM